MMARPVIRALLLAVFAAGFLLSAGSTAYARAATPKPAVATPTGSAKLTALQRIQMMVAKLNAEAATPAGEERVVTRLSTQLRVPAETLRQQRSDWGVGYGELAMLYGFARTGKPQVTADRVYEMRAEGMDWPAIAKALGVKIDAVATRMKRQQPRTLAAK